jgi:hypothetical protein
LPRDTVFAIGRERFAIIARLVMEKVMPSFAEITRLMVITIPRRVGVTRRLTGCISAAIRRSGGWSRCAIPRRNIRILGRRRGVLRGCQATPEDGGGDEQAE